MGTLHGYREAINLLSDRAAPRPHAEAGAAPVAEAVTLPALARAPLVPSGPRTARGRTVALTRAEVERRVAELGPWFHNFDLGGVQTAPDHFLGDYPAVKWRRFADAIPSDLHGTTVLDVGCNARLLLDRDEAARRRPRGRASTPTTDYLAQARFAAEVCGVDIELREMSVYDVAALGERFDVVLFMGVLYHLRHPLLALDLLHEHVVARPAGVPVACCAAAPGVPDLADDYPFADDGTCSTSPGYPKLHFVEQSYAGDPTNWWIPNRACDGGDAAQRGLRDRRPTRRTEVFVCRPGRAAGPARRGTRPRSPCRGGTGAGR